MDIETIDKNWKTQFSNKTKEYAAILYLADKGDKTAMTNVARLLFMARNVIGDSIFLKHYHEMLKNYIAETQKLKEVDPKKDAEILKEEEALHEQ